VLASGAFAQSYPTKPIRLIVAQAAGSSTDTLGRLVGKSLSDLLGQQVVIDNRPGAGGTLGTELAANAAADGYTLLLGNISTHAVNPALYAKLPYDPIKDFSPISMVAVTPNALVANPALTAATVPELIQLIKQKPAMVNFSSAGNGSAQHLAMALLEQMGGLRLVHVPYKGGNPAISAVVSGEVSLMVPTLPLAMPLVRSGRIKLLAVTSAQRRADMPEVPAVSETLPGFEVISWFGLVGPKGLPTDVVNKLNAALKTAIDQPDMKKAVARAGFDTDATSPAQFARYIRQELDKWRGVAAARGIKAE
jgi:tripartite-type tricarboxylate transporter receptor subunit TctC